MTSPPAFSLLTPAQAAAYLNVTVEDLARWRRSRHGVAPIGPKFVKLTERTVHYCKKDLDDYIEARKRGGAAPVVASSTPA